MNRLPIRLIQDPELQYQWLTSATRHELALAWSPLPAAFRLSGQDHSWQPGRIFLLQDNQRLRLAVIPKGLQLVVFEDWILTEFVHAHPEASVVPLFHPLGACRYTEVSEQIAIAMDGPARLMRTLHSFKLLNDYLQLLLRHLLEAAGFTATATPGQLPELLALLARHYKTERFLGFYAGELNADGAYLNRQAKKQLGQTVEQLIRRQLLAEGQRLLGFSGHQIKRIAADLGFNSTAAFSMFFKRGTGLSPQHFRNRLIR